MNEDYCYQKREKNQKPCLQSPVLSIPLHRVVFICERNSKILNHCNLGHRGIKNNSYVVFPWCLKNLERVFSKKGNFYVTQMQSYLKKTFTATWADQNYVIPLWKSKRVFITSKRTGMAVLAWRNLAYFDCTLKILRYLIVLTVYLLKINVQNVFLRLSLYMNFQIL